MKNKYKLSEREWFVFEAIATGSRLKQIAIDVNLSIKTISTYRTRILKKMNCTTNSQLTRLFISGGMCPCGKECGCPVKALWNKV